MTATPGVGSGPDGQVEARVLVRQGLAELSPRQRAVVVLHHLEPGPVEVGGGEVAWGAVAVSNLREECRTDKMWMM